jgi:hypothetical protein
MAMMLRMAVGWRSIGELRHPLYWSHRTRASRLL